jgi:hypothetical protein
MAHKYILKITKFFAFATAGFFLVASIVLIYYLNLVFYATLLFFGFALIFILTLTYRDFIVFSEDKIVRSKGFLNKIKEEVFNYEDIIAATIFFGVRSGSSIFFSLQDHLNHKKIHYDVDASFKNTSGLNEFVIFLNQKGIKIYGSHDYLSGLFGEEKVKYEKESLLIGRDFVDGHAGVGADSGK